MAAREERTFIMVKPDGVQRSLVGEIMERFEQRGYKLVGMKMMTAPKELLEMHYHELRERPFFTKLMEYMGSGPVVAMGMDVVSQGRAMLGATDPLKSAPGTIRGDYCQATGRNVCHGSDSKDSAAREIGLWFRDNELSHYTNDHHTKWVYE
ncbi:hypothetical protein PFISCL1PPCAC_9320 [Pristionchus fissidentatus]|uniref:Nucleoside diphosphate kinase n=1 Tax=Pristionchus fissidentatus TaxID=1538716 RepID=A0AAV5VIH3_9BILA|nr:hypothetical protein PFISCL1PPCAC_9320 [Pristionchus fissidentatus]